MTIRRSGPQAARKGRLNRCSNWVVAGEQKAGLDDAELLPEKGDEPVAQRDSAPQAAGVTGYVAAERHVRRYLRAESLV